MPEALEGTAAVTAIVAACRDSAISGPTKVAPTITRRSSSTTIREVPGALRPTKLAPALAAVSMSTARTSSPFSSAWATVRPTAATWGSVKMTRGEPALSQVAATSLPRMWSAAILPWYLPMWVSSARPLTSPIA